MSVNKKIKEIKNNPELLGLVEDKFGDLGRQEKEINDFLKPGGGRKKVRKYYQDKIVV
jgi:hypothetical protein